MYKCSKNILFSAGDGRLGLEKYAPYNAIHVGAAAEKIPQPVLKSLKNLIINFNTYTVHSCHCMIFKYFNYALDTNII